MNNNFIASQTLLVNNYTVRKFVIIIRYSSSPRLHLILEFGFGLKNEGLLHAFLVNMLHVDSYKIR